MDKQQANGLVTNEMVRAEKIVKRFGDLPSFGWRRFLREAWSGGGDYRAEWLW